MLSVSRSGGFGMTATRITASGTTGINILDEWVKADSGPFLLLELLHRTP